MKQVYKCDFCDEVFSNETEAKTHEEHCGRNPKNKINNSLIFRLSMIYETLPRIIACALHEVASADLPYLYSEVARADDSNCCYTVKMHQMKMLRSLLDAKKVKDKQAGRNSNTFKDVMREYPEIFAAIVKTLERRAWNEWEG